MAEYIEIHLMPPPPDRCQECGSDHAPDLPHNAQSLFYQTKFNLEHGRAATWIDAMAHCSDGMQRLWTSALEERGVDVAAGEIQPGDKKDG